MSGAFVAESDHLYSFKSLYDAYLSCRRRKRNTINALIFEEHLLDNLFELRATLAEGSYSPSRSVCFIAKQPKHREIFAADFRDRVVHHLLVPRLEAIFEPKFIHDSYACRKGKGTHAAVQRLRQFMNSITRQGQVTAWYLQLDIRSFFMSMDREILLAILARHLRDARLLELASLIVRNDCTRDFVYKGDPMLLQGIPSHKSMFHIPAGKGLPIGNLTSQFFGNLYLNELDQFVKHELNVKQYLRYVDDFVLLHTSREMLVYYRQRIEEFLAQRLALELKQEQTLKRVSEGADFLGYIVRPAYTLVRGRVVGNLRAHLRQFAGELLQGNGSHDETVQTLHLHLHEEPLRRLRQTLASYLGHFRHANARQLIRGLFKKFVWLQELFSLDTDCRLHPCYEPTSIPANLKEQYCWVAEQYSGLCIFFQVGRFCEWYGEQAEHFSRFFGLALQKDRRGLGSTCGFPLRLLQSFKKRIRAACVPYVVIGERGYYPTGLKKRVVTELFLLQRSMS
ncbi:MAG: reverse transcriptase domain-containing protein [Trichlorobacter sp.]|uniref:reverse transcriptase domain-containing protein n=1 Tax=Trichlorobacter sp. TaxID=2911007 RepID=UPI00256E3656|nr:reverse transcriptase domain-containing protein [Trichlorobacter sp.]MDK9719074.1 reverse transcriptase domain-containing protein [Trichlorobacter sp.]